MRYILVFSLLALIVGAACTPRRDIGNTLRVAQREKIKTLDPAHANDFFSGTAVRRTYEGLYQYHYLKRPYEVVPNIAAAMPAISADGKTYTIRLKQDVYFQDDACFPEGKGRRVVAKDFIFSWMRLADPKTASEVWWALDGRIVGLNEWREKLKQGDANSGTSHYDLPVEGLKAIDDFTLEVRLTREDPLFIHMLTMPATTVLAREAAEKYGQDLTTRSVGTGPFVLERFEQNQIIWTRHPKYRLETYPSEGEAGDREAGLLADAGKPIPFVDRIIDDVISEDQPAWLNFQQNNHDYLVKIPKDNAKNILTDDFKPTREVSERGMKLLSSPGVEFSYIAFNQTDPVVGGPKRKFLRQAMSLAYDEAPTIGMFYLGLGKKAESMIPPGVFGYDSEYKNKYREFNVAKAQELLAKNGFPEGKGLPELTYDLRSDPTARQVAEYFVRSMAKIGIRIKLNQVSWPELNSRIAKKQAQVWGGIVWVYDYPDPENGLQLLYGPREAPGSNKTSYKNPAYDVLFEKFIRTRDDKERLALIKRMRSIYEEDVPWIVAVHRNENRLTHSWLHNLKVHAFEYNSDKYLRVDAEARKRVLER